ncbi:MAG: hypothetical protein JW864_15615 [Spirochaetes bacterium]|nr:hypothetical protein [Spirochaetota bacterium]
MNEKIISIPIHNNRISPLFDVAGKFVILDSSQPEVKSYIDTTGLSGMSIIEKLKEHQVSTVICSAISKIYARALRRNNIGLVYGIIGSIDEIIDAYCNNKLCGSHFAMPGCRHKKRFRGECPYWDV